ncbi:unnamed protein product [Fusarium venenatum]|uniref:Uncharacterized protein n=1 Tax=Fusarium venenatum TaxID=56646 RepID=A0A2L2TRC5_9HYPO|nr:uncharacterized protein FVRRES_07916 [Fusarium venenatum]CEI63480.1 unnamed protein product [Fusarium venenatum]
MTVKAGAVASCVDGGSIYALALALQINVSMMLSRGSGDVWTPTLLLLVLNPPQNISPLFLLSLNKERSEACQASPTGLTGSVMRTTISTS